jgi:selenocysteine-specific elongation factor
VHIGAAEILARIVVLNEAGEIAPGKTGFVQFRLESPVVTIIGERFVVRSYSPQVTVAGGMILEPFAYRHRRKDLAVTNQFLRKTAESIGDPEILLANFIKRAAEKGISRSEVQARTGWQTGVLGKAITGLVERGDVLAIGDTLIGKQYLDELAAKALKAIEAFHKLQPLAAGITREALRNATFAGIPETIFYNVTGQLESKNLVVVEGEIFRLAGRMDQLTDAELAAKEQMLSAYSVARLEPPKLDEVLAASAKLGRDHARRVFQLLVNSGEVVKVNDEFYFASNAINDLAANMRSMAESSGDRSIDVARFKELAGVSRKYAIPLLEYFDREKVTVRSGDRRLILK